MAHAHFHSLSSAREHGGPASAYYPLHYWFDSTKQHLADARHRVILHNLGGLSLALKIFGDYTIYKDEEGKDVQVDNYFLGLQHINEDFGRTLGAEEILGFAGFHMHGHFMGFNRERALDNLIKKHRGKREDYQKIIDFFTHFMYWSHDPLSQMAGLAFLNNTFGIFQLEKYLGPIFKRESDSREIPTRLIGENYVNGGYGRIPTLNQVLETMPQRSWMFVNAAALSFEFGFEYDQDTKNLKKQQGVVPSPLPLE